MSYHRSAHDPKNSQPASERHNDGGKKERQQLPRLTDRQVVVGLTLLLLVTNAAWLTYTLVSSARAGHRRAEEAGWLKTAETLLLHEAEPVFRSILLPTALVPYAWGQAAVYETPDGSFYLLLHVDGLSGQSTYDVWLQDGDNLQHLGSVRMAEDGSGTRVYRFETEPPSGQLAIRQNGAPGPLLIGNLVPHPAMD